MAIVEEVKIKFTTDTSQLKDSKQELVDLGVVTKESANAFDQITTSATEANSAVASIGKTSSSGLEKVASSSEKAATAIKKTGQSAGQTQKLFQNLRQQIAQARVELDRVTIAYGKNSIEVARAKIKLAQLKDEYKDLNRQVGLLNPEDKIRAFNNFGQGVFSALSIVSGGLQAIGVQSDELDRVIGRISGAVSALYGITSFIQLKEQFEDVSVVLRTSALATETVTDGLEAAANSASTFTETATDVVTSTETASNTIKTYSDGVKTVKETTEDVKKALVGKTAAQVKDTASTVTATGATIAQDGATKAATTSTIAFGRALLASPLFLIAAALSAVVGVLYLYEKSQEDSRKKEEGAKAAKEGLKTAQEAYNDSVNEYLVLTGKKKQVDIDIENLEKQRNKDISEAIKNSNFQLLKEDAIAGQKRLDNAKELREKLGANITKYKDKEISDVEKENQVKVDRYNTAFNQLLEIQKKFLIDKNILLTKDTQAGIDAAKAETARIQAEIEAENQKRLQAQEEYVSKLMDKLEEEKRIRQDALTLKQTEGADQKDIIKQQIENNKLEIASLKNILEKARGTRQYAGIQSRINSLSREELNLQAQISKLITQDQLKAIDDRAKSREDEISLLQQIGTKELDILNYRINANFAQVGELNTLLLLTTNAKDREAIEEKINELLKIRKGLEVSKPQAEENTRQEILAEDLAAIEKNKEVQLAANAIVAYSNEELNKMNLDTDIKYLEQEIAIRKAAGEDVRKLEYELAAFRQKQRGEDIESLAKAEEEKLQTIEFFLNAASQSIQAITELTAGQYDDEIALLEDQKEKKLITEEDYNRRLNVLKNKQLEADKRAQIAQAIIGTAQGVINALNTQPANLVPFAVALATALGAFNIAKIQSQALPRYNKGTLSVGGFDTGDDSVMAMLRPGEAVIPVDTNKAYHPTIKAIYKKQIKPSELNAFVLNKLSGKNSIGNDTQITAKIDTYALTKAISKNKSVDVSNADYLAKMIANEIMNSYNPRRS